jgi:sn-glycerol 3-phosphate transport system ATP-binding protein
MGRAIVRAPSVFLFDEPLSNLDAKLRVQMRLEIRQLQSQMGVTALYVTHDQVEAMTMADRMIVMNDGRAEQIGTPLDVYERPRTLFAAQFIGSPSMNLLDAQARDGRISVGEAFIGDAAARTGPVSLGIRPEHVALDPDGPLELRAHLAEPLGANTLLHGTLGPTGIGFTASLPGVRRLDAGGETLRLSVQPGHLHLFDPASGLRLT